MHFDLLQKGRYIASFYIGVGNVSPTTLLYMMLDFVRKFQWDPRQYFPFKKLLPPSHVVIFMWPLILFSSVFSIKC